MEEFKTVCAFFQFVDALEILPENESGVNLPVLQILEFLVSYVSALSFHACKITKICSERCKSVIKSLKYCRILLFCVTFLCFSLFHSGFCCTFALATRIVVDHSAGRTSDAQL